VSDLTQFREPAIRTDARCGRYLGVSASTLAALGAAASLLTAACAADTSRQATTLADAQIALTPDERDVVGCYETVAFDVRLPSDTSPTERELLRPPARFALTPEHAAYDDSAFDGFKVNDDARMLPPTNHSWRLDNGTLTVIWGPSRATATAPQSPRELRGVLTRDSVMAGTGTRGDFRGCTFMHISRLLWQVTITLLLTALVLAVVSLFLILYSYLRWAGAGAGQTSGVALAHYELHAYLLLPVIVATLAASGVFVWRITPWLRR